MTEDTKKNARSPIWRFFEPVDPKNAKCLLCDGQYKNSGNTTNLIDHLKRRHRSSYVTVIELLKNPSNEVDEANFDSEEIPMAVENIKFEETTVQQDDPEGGKNQHEPDIIHEGDEILIEQHDESNQALPEAELEGQIITDNNDKAEFINMDLQEQDIQIVKV